MHKLLPLSILLLSAQIALAQPYGDGLVINEFMAANDSLSGITDPNGQFEDWIELYNNGNLTLNLENFTLSDKPDNPGKWVFPAGATLVPGGYLIIWADEDQSQPGLHANFKLSKDGEFLILSNPFGEVLDSLTFGPQDTNVAFARRPNGTGNFVKQAPTIGYNNDDANSTGQRTINREGLLLSPNPAGSTLHLSWKMDNPPAVKVLEVVDLSGRVLHRQTSAADAISLETIPAGSYLLRLETEAGVFGERFLKQ